MGKVMAGLHRFGRLPGACLAALLGLGGCEGVDISALEAPTITDTTAAPWLDGTPRRLTADVDVPSAWQVDAVYVRYARHHWPGHQIANEAEAPLDGGDMSSFAVEPADLDAAPRSHHLFYQWFLEYRLAAGGEEVLTVSSDVQDFVIGCTPAMTVADLNTAQAAVAIYNVSNPHIVLPALGYAGLPHYFVSIGGNGVAFASGAGGVIGSAAGPVGGAVGGALTAVGEALGPFGGPFVAAGGAVGQMTTSLQLSAPALLLYAPRPQAAGESDAAYMAAISDGAPDPPYTLRGWAYGTVYDAGNRPVMGCIPSSEWFVHEAGFHRTDGAMDFHQVDEAVAGASDGPGALPPPDAPATPAGSYWHPRIWDLHMWIAGPDSPPVLAINDPAGIPGIDLSAGFFYAETFE